MLGKGILGVVLACAPAWAVCADWVQVATSQNTAVFVDRLTLLRHGSLIEAWTKYQYEKTNSTDSLFGSIIAYSIGHEVYDCSARQRATRLLLAYDPGGNVLKSENPPTIHFVDAAPDTLGDAELRYVCGAV